MSKLNIKKFLVVLPLAASLFMNVNLTTKNESVSFENDNVTNLYEVNDKYKTIPAPSLALRVAKEGLKMEVSRDFPKSEMRVEDKIFDQKQAKIVSITGKKDDSIKVTAKKAGEEKDAQSPDKEKFSKMTEGYPIDEMLPFILKRDPKTAAFLVAIAKKESNWGKRAPYHNGKDCFNYWGFKDRRFTTVLGGHSCFPSAEKAVETVGNRIEKLVKSGLDTPSEFVIWKCGSACKGDGNASKWVSDVGLYYNKLKVSL